MDLSRRCGTLLILHKVERSKESEYRKSNRNHGCPNPYRSCQESRSVGLRSCPSCCFVPKRINFVLSGLIINWCSQSRSTTRWRSWETLANSRSVSKDLKERNSLVSYRPCKIQFHNLRRYSAIHWCKVWTIRDRESIIGELHNDR